MRGIYILTLVAIGIIIPAYAVEVPFEAETEDCQAVETTDQFIFDCRWTADKPFGIRVIQEGLDEDDIRTLDEIRTAKKDGTYERPPDQWKHEQELDGDDHPRTTLDWVTKRACESDRNSDIELCSHLNQLSSCEQGVTETESEPVSTYRKFQVSDGQMHPTQNFDLQDNGFLRDIYLKIEECYAIWQVLQPTVLGAQYLDFVRQVNDNQAYHADMAVIDPREQIRTHQPLTELSFERTTDDANRIYCYNEKYAGATKKLYCNPETETETAISSQQVTICDDFASGKLKASKIMAEYCKYRETDGIGYQHNGPSKFVTIGECNSAGENGVPTGKCNYAIRVD